MKKVMYSLSTILSLLLVTAGCSKNDDPAPEVGPYQQKIFLSDKGKALVQADKTFRIKLFKNLE